MKTYVITVSRNFPAFHPRKGQPTFFIEKIFNAMNGFIPCSMCMNERICQNGDHCLISSMQLSEKIHTIRDNYDLWKNRMDEVNAGNAILSIRYWSGKPYHKDENGIGQVEVMQLDKNSGCGVQKLVFFNNDFGRPCIYGLGYASRNHISELAKHDSLSLQDFKDWFKGYDLTKPMAIIHFTNFRY